MASRPTLPALGEDARPWVELYTLENTCLTTILTCLEGKERHEARQTALGVQKCLVQKDYGHLLGLLDAGDAKLVHGTDLIERSILAMLHDMRLVNPRDRDFQDAIGPYKKAIEDIAGAVAKAKSLTVLPDDTLSNTHDRLVDYVTRIRLRRQVMTDNPQFWRWLEGYPGIDGLLRRDEGLRLNKKNTFVWMLSVQFMGRERSKDHMAHVNSTCQKILDKCKDSDIAAYARKISEAYDTTFPEMQMFAILEKEFGDVQVEASIPNSNRNSDLGFQSDGHAYFVEVYTSKSFTFDHISTYRAAPQDEWVRLFRKPQVTALALANARTVFVLNVGSRYLPGVETWCEDFRAHVCNAMPETSETVIIRNGDVEVISVRGGRVVETTGLGKRLGFAIGNAWQ